MNALSIEVTDAELSLLLELAEEQLFRRQFIDPKMPGHRAQPERLETARLLVARLRRTRASMAQGSPSTKKAAAARVHTPSFLRSNDAV